MTYFVIETTRNNPYLDRGCCPYGTVLAPVFLCVFGCACHLVVSCRSLQHGGQEACGEGEAGQPEQDGGVRRRGPAGKLIHALAQVPGPGGQGLQGRVGLKTPQGDRDGWEGERRRALL